MGNLCTIRCSNKLNQIPAVLCKKCNLMQNVCFPDPIRFSLFSFASTVFGPHMRKKCATTLSIHPQNAIWIIWCFMLLYLPLRSALANTETPSAKTSHSILNFNYKLQDWYYKVWKIENLMKLNTSSKRKSNKLPKASHKTSANSKNERVQQNWFRLVFRQFRIRLKHFYRALDFSFGRISINAHKTPQNDRAAVKNSIWNFQPRWFDQAQFWLPKTNIRFLSPELISAELYRVMATGFITSEPNEFRVDLLFWRRIVFCCKSKVNESYL